MSRLASPGIVSNVPETTTRLARILAVCGRHASLLLDEVEVTATVAFSCLVQPATDDLAICTHTSTGEIYVLGIADRPGVQDMTLSVPANIVVSAAKGSISLMSGNSTTVAAAGTYTCLADRAVHKHRETLLDSRQIVATGEQAHASFRQIRVLSDIINTIAKQAIHRYKSYFRRTEEHDQVRSGQMTRDVKGLYTMDSSYTVMVSKKDTKIDGERIHMG